MSLQDQVANKVLLTKGALEAAINHIRGAVMISFPQGLPEWDLVRQALEGTEELAGTSVSTPHLSWAALYSTWLLIKSTPEGIRYFVLFFSSNCEAHACAMLCILPSCSAR